LADISTYKYSLNRYCASRLDLHKNVEGARRFCVRVNSEMSVKNNKRICEKMYPLCVTSDKLPLFVIIGRFGTAIDSSRSETCQFAMFLPPDANHRSDRQRHQRRIKDRKEHETVEKEALQSHPNEQTINSDKRFNRAM
jgi:hypothetical protein